MASANLKNLNSKVADDDSDHVGSGANTPPGGVSKQTLVHNPLTRDICLIYIYPTLQEILTNFSRHPTTRPSRQASSPTLQLLCTGKEVIIQYRTFCIFVFSHHGWASQQNLGPDVLLCTRTANCAQLSEADPARCQKTSTPAVAQPDPRAPVNLSYASNVFFLVRT